MRIPIADNVAAGCDLADLDPEDVAMVALGAAAWATGLPIAENENLPTFQAATNRVLGAFGISYEFEAAT